MATRTVYKYEVGFGPGRRIELPAGARLLHCDVQHGAVWVWALVDLCDPETPVEERDVGFFATGEAIPSGFEYVGTAASPDRSLIWHVFERAA